MAVDSDFASRFRGGGLLTTEVVYFLPDHKNLLQSFVWQTIDTAPTFPRLHAFLDHWRRDVEAVIHLIRIAHSDWVGPAEIRTIDGRWTLN